MALENIWGESPPNTWIWIVTDCWGKSYCSNQNKIDCGLVFAGYSSEAAGEGDERGEEETEAAGSQLWGGVLWGSRRWGDNCLFMFLFHRACVCTNSRLYGHMTTSCCLFGFWIWICAGVLLMLHSAGDCIWPRKLFLGNASICLQLTKVGCLWNFFFLHHSTAFEMWSFEICFGHVAHSRSVICKNRIYFYTFYTFIEKWS